MRRRAGALTPTELSILDAALRLLNRGEEEFYGFLIAKEIKEAREARLLTSRGTVYRALWRLEGMGFLLSRWEDPAIAADNNRPRRKFYKITPAGAVAFANSPGEDKGVSQIWRTAPE